MCGRNLRSVHRPGSLRPHSPAEHKPRKASFPTTPLCLPLSEAQQTDGQLSVRVLSSLEPTSPASALSVPSLGAPATGQGQEEPQARGGVSSDRPTSGQGEGKQLSQQKE